MRCNLKSSFAGKKRFFGITSLVLALSTVVASAEERRSPPPTFSRDQTRGIFFENLEDAFRGGRPTLSSIRETSQTQAIAAAASEQKQPSETSDDVWSTLISPVSIEDEVKRVRLHYDAVVTTPGEFNSGGYQDARLDLTVLATLFAVINEHSGDVRWKEEAAAARDLLARTAFNSKAGSTQVYNEAKARKADLQDLVSGSGLAGRDAEPENEWAMIADRSPLMEYAEQLVEGLEDATRDASTAEEEADAVRRNAELLAMLGEVLTREGMAEADDEDYAKLSREMSDEAIALVKALQRNDYETVTSNASMIRQRCDACHEQYR